MKHPHEFAFSSVGGTRPVDAFSKPVRLICIPGFGNASTGPVPPTDEKANAWGWFIDQPD